MSGWVGDMHLPSASETVAGRQGGAGFSNAVIIWARFNKGEREELESHREVDSAGRDVYGLAGWVRRSKAPETELTTTADAKVASHETGGPPSTAQG